MSPGARLHNADLQFGPYASPNPSILSHRYSHDGRKVALHNLPRKYVNRPRLPKLKVNGAKKYELEDAANQVETIRMLSSREKSEEQEFALKL